MIDTVTLQQVAARHRAAHAATWCWRPATAGCSSANRSQVDVISPLSNPVVLATNPPDQSIVALPLSLVTVTFDQNMVADLATNGASATNPANYTLVGADGKAASVLGVGYDAATHTALLRVDGLTAEQYTLTISAAITGTDGFPLAGPYTSTFNAVNDVSDFSSIQITDTRLDRLTQTLSYQVTVTNTTNFDLLLPLLLTLDPAKFVQGGPARRHRPRPAMAAGSSAWRATCRAASSWHRANRRRASPSTWSRRASRPPTTNPEFSASPPSARCPRSPARRRPTPPPARPTPMPPRQPIRAATLSPTCSKTHRRA